MTPETSTADIPLIDIAPLYSEDPSDWVDVARHIDHACQRTGFFMSKATRLTRLP